MDSHRHRWHNPKRVYDGQGLKTLRANRSITSSKLGGKSTEDPLLTEKCHVCELGLILHSRTSGP